MYFYLYKVSDPTTGEFYIGSRISKIEPDIDSYKGSMKTWKPNKEKLIKEIIDKNFTNREDLINAEANLISQVINDPLNRNYYIPTLGFSTFGMKYTEEAKSKLRGKVVSEETKKKISNSNKGKTRSEETKEKIKNALNSDDIKKKMKLPKSEEFKEKLRSRIVSEETKEKMSLAKQNISDETRIKLKEIGKLRVGENNPMFGKSHSEETKQKMRKPKSKKSNLTDSHKNKIQESLKGKSKEIIQCPYCKKEGGAPQMKQWHFDKCKLRFGDVKIGEETKNITHVEEEK